MSLSNSNQKTKYGYLPILMGGFLYLTGLYYEWAVVVSVMALSIGLIYSLWRKPLQVYLSADLFALLLILAGGVGMIFLGIDPGKSIYGLLRIVGALLFVIAMMQECDVLYYIPYAMALMMVISIVLYLMPTSRELVYVDGRFVGFPGYANVMAMLLLISIVLLTECQEHIFLQLVMMGLFLFGILWTGSRMVAILVIPTLIWLLWKCKPMRKQLLLLYLLAAVGVVAFLITKGLDSSFTRFLSVLSDAKSNGLRLIYYQDALREIIHHPFGQGYQSFYELQGSIQGGIYTSRYIHNSYLEVAFSLGWIPALAMFFLTIRGWMYSWGAKRMILILFTIHFFMDFDLQFMSMVYIALSCMEWRKGRLIKGSGLKSSILVIGLLSTVVGLWLGIANFLAYIDRPKDAARIYPYDWEYQSRSMVVANNQGVQRTQGVTNTKDNGLSAVEYAKKAVKLNSHDSNAWKTLGNQAMLDHNRDQMMEYDLKALENDSCNESLYYQVLNQLVPTEGDRFGTKELEYLSEVEDIAKRADARCGSKARELNLVPNYNEVLLRINEIEGLYGK